MPKLTALGVRNAKPGRHADGGGLYLLVKPTGARSWVLRVQHMGKRRDIGIGAVNLLPKSEADKEATERLSVLEMQTLRLEEAREKAAALRKLAKAAHEGRLRSGNLPQAMDIQEEIPSFESLRDYSGKSFRINNIGVVPPPPWEYNLGLNV